MYWFSVFLVMEQEQQEQEESAILGVRIREVNRWWWAWHVDKRQIRGGGGRWTVRISRTWCKKGCGQPAKSPGLMRDWSTWMVVRFGMVVKLSKLLFNLPTFQVQRWICQWNMWQKCKCKFHSYFGKFCMSSQIDKQQRCSKTLSRAKIDYRPTNTPLAGRISWKMDNSHSLWKAACNNCKNMQ